MELEMSMYDNYTEADWEQLWEESQARFENDARKRVLGNKHKWGTNFDVCVAFALRRPHNMQSKHMAYEAGAKEVWSYGLKIGQWDDAHNRIIVVDGSSSTTTQCHLGHLRNAIHRFANSKAHYVALENGGSWGYFPKEENWDTILRYDYYDQRGSLLSHREGRWVLPGNDEVEIAKLHSVWMLRFGKMVFYCKYLSDVRKIITAWYKRFTCKHSDYEAFITVKENPHVHVFEAIERHDTWIEECLQITGVSLLLDI
jgi:hypothetical protein